MEPKSEHQDFYRIAEPMILIVQDCLSASINNGLNDPIIQVGMGHVELLEGKTDMAKQRF